MCKQCVADLERWQRTGELPPAWKPEPNPVDATFDARLEEINRELDDERELIEGGAAEPPRFGWAIRIARMAS